jgi:hypothetical protein
MQQSALGATAATGCPITGDAHCVTCTSVSNPDALKSNPDLVIRIKAEKEKRQLIIEGALTSHASRRPLCG